jgi:cob(I)alamin adenosyltransferase
MDGPMALIKGYLQVYTGNGKGKTTASLGLALRAAGAGLKVHMVQFMKGRRYSEIDAVTNILNFTISQHGRDEFVSKENPERVDIELARDGFEKAKEVVMSGDFDLVILDEINVATDYGLLTIQEVVGLIENRPDHVELVLTGRYAPKEFIEMADLVTEMCEKKHFYNEGVEARKGIEF